MEFEHVYCNIAVQHFSHNTMWTDLFFIMLKAFIVQRRLLVYEILEEYCSYGHSGRVIPETQKWHLMPLCLTFSIIMYGSRGSVVNQGKV